MAIYALILSLSISTAFFVALLFASERSNAKLKIEYNTLCRENIKLKCEFVKIGRYVISLEKVTRAWSAMGESVVQSEESVDGMTPRV